MIIVNGEIANIEVSSGANMTVSGNVVNMNISGATGATGPQGEPGTPALERKLAIYRIRQNDNTSQCEVEESFNNTDFAISLTANYKSNIDIVSTLFEDRPFNVIWNGGPLKTPGYISQPSYYLLTDPLYIFSDFGSGISDWSWVIIEDLGNYLP